VQGAPKVRHSRPSIDRSRLPAKVPTTRATGYRGIACGSVVLDRVRLSVFYGPVTVGSFRALRKTCPKPASSNWPIQAGVCSETPVT